MRNAFLIFIAVFILHTASPAQTKLETEVAQAVEKLKTGMINGDKNILNNITLPELSYGHSSGKIEDKAAFVESLTNGSSDFVSIDLTNQTVKVVGNTAIVRHNLAAETKDKGVPGSVKLAILLVWQKQQNQWKLLARQAVKLQ